MAHHSALKPQGHIRIPPHQADVLFGKIGTHSRVAGATLWLRDIVNNNQYGRQVTVLAEGRRVAAAAINAALFQLCHEFGRKLGLKDSEWFYIKGEKQGPHPHAKMLKWAKRGWFPHDDMPVQHAALKCWVPLWFLLQMDSMQGGSAGAGEEAQAVSMDMDTLVHDLKKERQSGLLTASVALGPGPEEFPELCTEDSAEPMDYEGSATSFNDGMQGGARLLVVVDTSVLMANMAAVERIFEDLAAASGALPSPSQQGSTSAAPAAAAGAVAGNGPSGPLVEALLVVPWVVLNELDKLKHSTKREQSESARYALARLRQLTSARDTFVRAQTAAEHVKAIKHASAALSGHARELANDDLIMQTCDYYRSHLAQRMRGMGLHSAVLLLTNDHGLCVRAQVNGIKCYSAHEMPRDSQVLVKESAEWEAEHPADAQPVGGAVPPSQAPPAAAPAPQHTTPPPALRVPAERMQPASSGALSPTYSGSVPPGFSPRAGLPVSPNASSALQPPSGLAAGQGREGMQAQALALQQQQRQQEAAEAEAQAERLRHLHLHQAQQEAAAAALGGQQVGSRSSVPPPPPPQQQQQPQPQEDNPAAAVAAMLAQSVGLTAEQLFAGLGEAQSGDEPSPQILAVLQLVQRHPQLLQALHAAAGEQQAGPGRTPSAGSGNAAAHAAAAHAAAAEQAAASQQVAAQRAALQRVAEVQAAAAAAQAQQVAVLQQLASMDMQQLAELGLNPAQILELEQSGLLPQRGPTAAEQRQQQQQQQQLAAAMAQQAEQQQQMLAAAMQRSGSMQSSGSGSGLGGQGSGVLGLQEPAAPSPRDLSVHAMQQQQQQQQAALLEVLAHQQAAAAAAAAGLGGPGQQAFGMPGGGMLRAASSGPPGMVGRGSGELSRMGLAARGSGELPSPGLPGGLMLRQASGEAGGAGAAARANPPESWDRLTATVLDIVERCVAPFVAYHRQQEFGDFWLDMLGRDHQPPWDARATMEILSKGDFSGFLSRNTRDEQGKQLERFCYQRWRAARGPGQPRPPDPQDVRAAATSLVVILQELARNVHKPVPNAETPNPEAIGPEFVSLGAASAAVQQGLGAAQVLLARCSQRLQLHQQAGGLM